MATFIADHEAEWKDGGRQSEQWTNSLTAYAVPIIGKLLVRDISTTHVLQILEQPADAKQPKGPKLWHAKNPTADRVRNRIELIWAWAKSRGFCLEHSLPYLRDRTEHHAAVAVKDMPALMARVRTVDSTVARALEFALLTLARTKEVCGATGGEVNLEERVWVVPAERMKAGKEYTVVLSDAAIELLQALPQGNAEGFMVPGRKPQTCIAENSMLALLKRQLGEKATVHGTVRASFRTWSADHTEFAHEVAEMALAHTIKNKVEAAYRRGQMVEHRLPMMNSYAAFLAGAEARGGNVVPISAGMAA